MRNMPWTSRRRPNAWSERSPLELDRSTRGYATFAHSYARKERNCNSTQFKLYPLWTISCVIVGAVLLYRSVNNHSSLVGGQYSTSPLYQWDHNHYVSSRDAMANERNLLIAQISPFGTFAEITSRPNRAYARRWRWDFSLHTQGGDASCGAVTMLNRILSQQQQRPTNGTRRAPYDAILFLSEDAVIMDLDYEFLALLPENKIVAMANAKPDLFLWNLKHKESQEVARMWLDLADDSNCDTQSLWSAIEMTMADSGYPASYYVQQFHLSIGGIVEPKLIKFLPSNEADGKSFPETMATLETVADSVCYRYYPRCEVL